MAWVKTSDSIYDHPKWQDAMALAAEEFGPLGIQAIKGFGHHATTWSSKPENLTDGFIPRSWCALQPEGLKLAPILAEAGIWHEDAARNGWQIHDYADYQPTRAQTDAKREKDLERKKRGGSKSATKHSERNPNGIHAEESSPVPVPVPLTTRRECAGVRVSGKPVNEAAWALTEQILEEYCRQADVNLMLLTGSGDPSEAAKRVYGRVVKYPAISFDEHKDIISRTLSSRWWGQGRASIGVVYGPKVFEENITRPATPLGKPADLKAERDRKRLEAMARLVDGGGAA